MVLQKLNLSYGGQTYDIYPEYKNNRKNTITNPKIRHGKIE